METHDQILCEHYERMLGLTEGWKVSGVDLRLEDKRLELRLGWERSGAICPECGASMNRHDLSPERKWRHLDSMGFETILLARIPRANCPEHGVTQMKVPWAEKHSRFTLAFEAFAIKVLQASRSVVAAKGMLGLTGNRFKRSWIGLCNAGSIAGVGMRSRRWGWMRRVSFAGKATRVCFTT